MRITRYAAALLLSFIAIQSAWSQTGSYPDRPIRMIAPSSAGGPTDVIARVVSSPLAEILGR